MDVETKIIWPGRWQVGVMLGREPYKGALVNLWRSDLTEEEARAILAAVAGEHKGEIEAALAGSPEYILDYVGDTFDNVQLGMLRKWFSTRECEVHSWPARIPDRSSAGVMSVAFSSSDRFFEFWERDDYDLPFRVRGILKVPE